MRSLGYCAFLICLTLSSVVAQTQDQTDTVSISGEVRKPGRFAVKQPISLVDALTLAGGVTPIANLHAIELTHNDTVHIIDFYAVMQGKVGPVHIEPGDTVRVTVLPRRGRNQ